MQWEVKPPRSVVTGHGESMTTIPIEATDGLFVKASGLTVTVSGYGWPEDGLQSFATWLARQLTAMTNAAEARAAAIDGD